jgi:glucose-1-phosphate thymidylyltransferase
VVLEVPVLTKKTMNIIIPMAGRGSRLRPHTLTVPKPLIPVGGVPIVHRLVEDIAKVCGKNIQIIGFVTGDFGKEVEQELCNIAEKFGATGRIFHQLEPLGTGHAVHCAAELLLGPVVVAFADTLFRADFSISSQDEGILWVKKIPNPEQFGVIKLNSEGSIVDYVEKPQTFVSDLAMIGIYYVRRGEDLLRELNYLIDHKVIKGGEYQLPDALRRLTEQGVLFKPGEVTEWMDCGNKTVTIETNARVLEFDFMDKKSLISACSLQTNCVVVPPCFIGENVQLTNVVIGPFVSIGKGTKIVNCCISNSIIQEDCHVENAVLQGSMIGSKAQVHGRAADVSLGDYCEYHG